MNKNIFKKVVALSLMFSIIFSSFGNVLIAKSYKPLKLEEVKDLKNVNIDNVEDVPKEVRDRIKELQSNKNVREIKLNKSSYKTDIADLDKNNSNKIKPLYWGTPYKGHKKMMFKEWLIEYHFVSSLVDIKTGKWKDISNSLIKNIVKSGTGFLMGAVNVYAGVAYTILENLLDFSSKKNIPNANQKVTYQASISGKKIEKHTYVKDSTGEYVFGAVTEKIIYGIQRGVKIIGKGVYSENPEHVKRHIVHTENYKRPDRKAWNAIYNPWVERIGHIEYGGLNFSTDGVVTKQ